MTPIDGFRPDADPTRPGVLTDCQHVYSAAEGYTGTPSPVNSSAPALDSPARGAAVVKSLDGTRSVFAGTQTKLYRLNSATSWEDVSRAAGYVGSSESRWVFAQFGNTTLASNLADPMQQAGVGVDYADVPTAPKAKIIVSSGNNFVLAFHTNDATYGDSPDRWWSCAQNNQNDWTPNVSTGATTGRLIGSEGPITAALVLGDLVVAYKEDAMFIGSFVGSPVGFQWNKIPGGPAGCVGLEALADVGGAHFIVGPNNFWLFDGTRPVPLGVGDLRNWFYANSSSAWLYRTQVTFDKQRNIVRIAYPSAASNGALDSVINYSMLTKKWGRDDATIQCQLNYVEPGTTIDGMDNYAATINALPNIPVNSPFWQQGGRVASYFNSSNKLVSLNGLTKDSFITTGDIGADDQVTMIGRFRPRYLTLPTTAQATGYYRMSVGEAGKPGPINAINDGKFDLRQSARWHRVRLDMTGPHVITAFDVAPIPVGMR